MDNLANNVHEIRAQKVITQAIEIDNVQIETLTAIDPHAGKNFAFSVAMSGEWALVGAHGAHSTNGNTSNSGSAYLFQYTQNGWEKKQTLQPDNLYNNAYFGYSVAIEGDWLIIGTLGDNTKGQYSGCVYVYKNNQGEWQKKQTITANDSENNDYFGRAVALHGHRILVGADGHAAAGAAYLFEYQEDSDSWQQIIKFQSQGLESGDYFGSALALGSDWLMIGAYGDSDSGSCSGSVYAYEYSNGQWLERQKLSADNAIAYDYFGAAVALEDGCALIGAYGADTPEKNVGGVYVFSLSDGNWQQSDQLQALDHQSGSCFGKSIALNGDWALIGAPNLSQVKKHAGACYLFEQKGGQWFEKTLLSIDQTENSYLGTAVALTDTRILMGANGESSAGEAYALALPERLDVADELLASRVIFDDVSMKINTQAQQLDALDVVVDDV